MEKYSKIIEKYKNQNIKPSALSIIEEILLESGKQGALLSEIYTVLKEIGFTYNNSVIRAYMNRNIVGSPIKGGHNLWYRIKKATYYKHSIYRLAYQYSINYTLL